MLNLRNATPPDRCAGSSVIALDLERALRLPEEARSSPLVLLHGPQGTCLFGLDGMCNAPLLIGDGQHRIAKAFFGAQAPLSAWLLDQQQSDRYLTVRLPNNEVRIPRPKSK